MAITKIRGNKQIMDASINLAKLQSNFVKDTTWVLSDNDSAVLTGLATPANANDAVTKGYVDGLVDSNLKAPDSFATTTSGDYPSDYKGTGVVSEGDMFYVTDITNGNTVGSRTVNIGDALVALVDNPGNTDSNWLIMESNRDQATEDVKGVAEIATQAETDAGVNDETIVTPLKLTTFISNQGLEKHAGNGLTEDTGHNFNVGAADASIKVNPDDIQVQVGTSNGGASLEVTATGVELASTIVGARTFSDNVTVNDAFTTNGATNLGGTTADNARLGAQPTGTVDEAIATVKYVNDEIASATPNIIAGDGLTSTTNGSDVTIDVVAADASLDVQADSVGVQVGSTNGTSLEITTTGVELADTISGARTFTGAFTASGTVTLGTNANDVRLVAQPDGTVDEAVATTKYVDDAIDAIPINHNYVYNETPTVTDGSTDVALAHTPVVDTQRVYLNGVRQVPGSGNDYTISGSTITFADALTTDDIVVVDYLYDS